MTNEQMDALFRKVFNDLEPGDEQLLASASGEAMSQEQTILTNLQSEFAAMRDIPECQLSTERLRDAILSRGAMPQRTSPFKSWWKFAVPVAASVALGAFLMMNPATTRSMVEEPTATLANNEKVDIQPTLEPTVDPSAIENTLGNGSVPDEALATTTEPVVEADKPAPKVSPATKRSGSSNRYASAKPITQPVTLDSGDIASMSFAAKATPRSSAVSGIASGALEGFRSRGSEPDMVADSAKSKNSDSTVVIVGAGTDPNTRANPATEVDKKNVVFGG